MSLSYDTLYIIYNNMFKCMEFNGIEIKEKNKLELNLFKNLLESKSYERCNISGSKDNKNYTLTLLSFDSKYGKKKEGERMIKESLLKNDKTIIICQKDDQIKNLLNLINIDNELNPFLNVKLFIVMYKCFTYNNPKHSHASTSINVLDKSSEELLLDTYKIKKKNLPKININDAELIWYFSKVNLGDIIVITNYSDNAGIAVEYRYVI